MKYRFLASTLLGAVVLAGAVWAADQEIEVSAKLRTGITFTNKVDMDFTPTTQYIDLFTPTGADSVKLGTDGVEVGTAGMVPTVLTGTPGSVDVNGEPGSSVAITCNVSATLVPVSGTGNIVVNNMEIDLNTGTATGSGAYDCVDLGATAHPHTMDADGIDTILLGGELVGAVTMHTTTYNTTTGAGVPAVIRVVYP